jgi:hypothetical protein
MKRDYLIMHTRAKTLEDVFFLKQDRILTQEFHKMEKMKETKAALARVSGITNEDVLQKLIDLDIRPDAAACLALVPLVEIAWADGKIDDEEKAAVLKADRELFPKNSADMKILKQWLEHKPKPQLLTAWKHYVKELCRQMTPSQKKALRAQILGHARQVAQATGGFLGLGKKISGAEQDMLDKLDKAFE